MRTSSPVGISTRTVTYRSPIAAPDNFGSYKFPIADVIRGQLKAVPRGIIAAAAVIDGARGGAKIPQKDIPAIKAQLAKYYEKMGEQPPWEKKKAS